MHSVDTSPTLYEQSATDRPGFVPAVCDVETSDLPTQWLREDNGLPELSELQVARHFERLAHRNFGVESGFYPLGSCTMKYNPKVCESVQRLSCFTHTHPLQPASTVQGNLALMYALQSQLATIGGFDAVSLQPSAGAHGEFAALLMTRQYHRDQGQSTRNKVLIPDSAHGTNPASTAMAGYEVIEIPSDDRGNVDLDALTAICDAQVAALMLTNPNTLGLFDENLDQIIQCVHDCGAIVYGDGANMNALTGIMCPGHAGIDLMHYNLHKTFGTPHGGGGPGSGPLAANAQLASYLPGPIVCKRRTPPADGTAGDQFELRMPDRSIGEISGNYGNFGTLVRAYTYLLMHGSRDLRANAEHAVLNANYLRAKIAEHLLVPFDRRCMHEFVCEGRIDGVQVRAVDISKRLMDYGFHPPTNYFPLTVHEALMIEPTETESKATLDAFASAIAQIVQEAKDDPDRLHRAPHHTVIGRLDEVYAARHLILTDPCTRGCTDQSCSPG